MESICEKEVAMNEQVLKGRWTELKGKAKEKWGRLSNDELEDRRQYRSIDRPPAATLRTCSGRGAQGSGGLVEGKLIAAPPVFRRQIL
jgi:hypothetical protein